ncbi:hypothetical protein D3H65_07340 [Paraflavitalea soli]|uniref:GDYXXLXY domain-containing protein n=1 Tax=Paraflavitalea soli TaxID=2315862 RepID=A0A3B7MTI1_9BACT|nr:GDYXXLXY domain-containing protein [Paraflavitalea soli]AXY73801.1 hypothetical protein D3H65_07340 [Paraflavitalea soli]
MKKYKIIILVLNLLLVLVFFHYSISKKETILHKGTLVLLELAPVDPRSLIQGDYMDLRYAIARETNADSIPKRGYCVVSLDSGLIARKIRLQQHRTPRAPNEYLIGYTADRWNINIGAESFFFQEGQAEKFGKAKYGAIKIDGQGNSLLVGLYDAHRQLIK